MSAIEINKFAGALLSTALFLMATNMLGDYIFAPHHTAEAPKYIVPTALDQSEPIEAQQNLEPNLDLLLAQADASSGEKISKKCVACHTFAEGGSSKIGPNLWDILGRDIASDASFKYSTVMKNMEGSWTVIGINAFLTSPKKYAKGTKMAFPGLAKPSDRADVIMYLRSLSSSPIAIQN